MTEENPWSQGSGSWEDSFRTIRALPDTLTAHGRAWVAVGIPSDHRRSMTVVREPLVLDWEEQSTEENT